MKRLLSILLAITIVFTLFTEVQFSSNAADLPASGKIGANVFYTFDSQTGLLTISGSGSIYSYHEEVLYNDISYSGKEEATSPFAYNGSIKQVVFENGILNVSRALFYDCRYITDISLSNSITTIDDYAFSICSGLTSITIPDSVTSIGSAAFRYCRKLTDITIPDSVTSIGDSAFSGCSGLTGITIPDFVTSIGGAAFSGCSGLTGIIIPDSVTSIGMYAFSGCSSLTNISIPDSVTSIGMYAFERCSSLAGVYITDLSAWCKISFDYSYSNPLIHAHKLYLDNELITDLEIPDTVTSIGDKAFSGCSGLTSVTIPDSVTSIGGAAFSGCSGLTSVTIPDSVTSIGDSAFSGCSGLTSIMIPNSVTSIGNYAFYDCSGLTSITIGNSVISIGMQAFQECVSLEKILFKDLASWCRCYGGYRYLGLVGILSLDNQSLMDIDVLIIPDSADIISERAFQNCNRLTSVYIPRSVHTVDKNAFFGCSNVKSLTIPYEICIFNRQEARVETQFSEFNTSPIEKITFCDNPIIITDKFNNLFKLESLKEFEIPESVSYIGDAAFKDCENLTTVTIPKSVTRIEYNAFSGCTNLTVRGYQGSYAETFCKWAGIPFEAIEEPHTHSFTTTITQPTCTKRGFTTHTCSCGESYVDTYISALGHNTEAKTVVKSTGIQLGYTVHSCSRCGEKQKVDSYTAPIGKLTLKHSARTANAIKVQWNNVKTATGYQVQLSTKDGKKWSTYATLKAGVTAFTFKNLVAGNNYKFRVRFYIKAADGKNYFSPWSATLNSPTLPTGTTLTKLSPSSKAFTAQWKVNKTVTGYQIQYSTNSKFTGAKTVTVKSNKTLKTTVKKLSAKKVYYVRIRTYKTISKVNYFSTWSKAVKVKTK